VKSDDISTGAEVHSVGEVLDRIDHAADTDGQTSFSDVLKTVGDRSFGPLLLLAGLVMLAPVIGDIPGVPVLMGFVVILTAAQFVFHRKHIWLPGWLLRRSVKAEKIRKAVSWLRPVGRFVDRWSKRRLVKVTHGAGFIVIAVACIVIAAATPLMEIVPMSANLAGLAITAFGLALIVSDGLIGIFALAFSAATFFLIFRQMTN
jgi:hypothetical protein